MLPIFKLRTSAGVRYKSKVRSDFSHFCGSRLVAINHIISYSLRFSLGYSLYRLLGFLNPDLKIGINVDQISGHPRKGNVLVRQTSAYKFVLACCNGTEARLENNRCCIVNQSRKGSERIQTGIRSIEPRRFTAHSVSLQLVKGGGSHFAGESQ